MLTAIPCTLMRGGTSKGLYFHADDLPAERPLFDHVLLAAMGSPDARQIDGVGGAHPLTSKVAVISRATRADADVDYLFLQVVVDKREVSDSQNCGNLLAGVGPWAIENGFVAATDTTTPVRIHMVNTRSIAVAHVSTPGGRVEYEGETRIDGVPGSAAAIPLEFLDIAGSSCGSMLPTGSPVDTIEGIQVTCIDNGMPVVVMRAEDLGVSGSETPEQLERNVALKARVENMRLHVGPRMNLGEVTNKTVPKMCLVSAPATRRRDCDAHVHSPSRARRHRRAGCGERGDGLRHSRIHRRGNREGRRRRAAPTRHRASDRVFYGRHGG